MPHIQAGNFLFQAVLTLVILMIFSCGSSRNAGVPNNYEELRQLIDSRQFQIEQDWAHPLGGGRINLIGNPNFIRFKGDSAEVFQPYFGVRRTGGGYGDPGGLEFEGVPKNLRIEKDDARQRIVIKFEGNEGTENLEFHIILFANGNTSTNVNTSQRDPISYQGNIRKLPQEFRKE